MRTWAASEDVQRHIKWLLNNERQKTDREAIKEELHPRPNDIVYEDYRGDYVVKVAGLTRDQALQIYRMAEAIRGEVADASLEES